MTAFKSLKSLNNISCFLKGTYMICNTCKAQEGQMTTS